MYILLYVLNIKGKIKKEKERGDKRIKQAQAGTMKQTTRFHILENNKVK